MIENCKKYLIKGSKTHSKTLSLYTVESTISKQMGIIQRILVVASPNVQENFKLQMFDERKFSSHLKAFP